MDALVRSDPTVNFFMSSDDPAEEEAVRARFGDRILPSPRRIIGRLTDEALEAAIVDLFCLAATRKIIGSFMSSFSGSAARIGNIPFEEILCEDNPVVRW
ncbi:hypothetical protein [Hoeflea poritis]|uniref:Uncharacterized protein n=1 Tax=Hoeflea poritis TaxID=2993659 RepID=A0ABT4VHH8_9HYPH|nr:hypothetical protein [Hoeflea poritis]MDA4844059.1 hypothetical protein [Hoeflea poritis]